MGQLGQLGQLGLLFHYVLWDYYVRLIPSNLRFKCIKMLMRCRLIDETLLYVKMRVLNNVQDISML